MGENRIWEESESESGTHWENDSGEWFLDDDLVPEMRKRIHGFPAKELGEGEFLRQTCEVIARSNGWHRRKTMFTKKQASEMILSQHLIIMQAINRLQFEATRMTSEIDPANATWGDVAKFAAISDAASEFLHRLDCFDNADAN